MDKSKRFFFLFLSKNKNIQTNLCVDDREISVWYGWPYMEMLCDTYVCYGAKPSPVRSHNQQCISVIYRVSLDSPKMHLDFMYRRCLSAFRPSDENPFWLMTKAQCFYCLTNDNGMIFNRNKLTKCILCEKT